MFFPTLAFEAEFWGRYFEFYLEFSFTTDFEPMSNCFSELFDASLSSLNNLSSLVLWIIVLKKGSLDSKDVDVRQGSRFLLIFLIF